MHTSIARKTSPDENPQLKELSRPVDRPGLAGTGSWIWLAIAAVLLLFSNGANTVPLAAWLAPVFICDLCVGRVSQLG